MVRRTKRKGYVTIIIMSKVSILHLLKTDMKGLNDRLNKNFEDYMRVFSLKRRRDHFDDIFQTKFSTATIEQLSELSEGHFNLINEYYDRVNNTYLYLKFTEDMPAMVKDKVSSHLRDINKLYNQFVDFDMNELSDIEQDSVDLPPPFEEDEISS